MKFQYFKNNHTVTEDIDESQYININNGNIELIDINLNTQFVNNNFENINSNSEFNRFEFKLESNGKKNITVSSGYNYIRFYTGCDISTDVNFDDLITIDINGKEISFYWRYNVLLEIPLTSTTITITNNSNISINFLGFYELLIN